MTAHIAYAAMRTPHVGTNAPLRPLREDILPALGLMAARLANRIGCLQITFSSHAVPMTPVSHELAAQLELAGLGRADHWIAQQAAYDLWQGQQKSPQK